MKVYKQSGMTLIGFMIVLSLVIFITFIGMKIGPIYMEYYSVVSAMNGVASERGSARYSPYDIKVKVLNRLYVSYWAPEVHCRQEAAVPAAKPLLYFRAGSLRS